MATKAKAATPAIEQMNLAQLNELGAKVRARYDELRNEVISEIELTMTQYGISEKMLAESLIKRRGPRKVQP